LLISARRARLRRRAAAADPGAGATAPETARRPRAWL